MAKAIRVIILSPGLASARRVAQGQVPANQLGQVKMQDQPNISHQAVVVKGDVNPVVVDAW